MIWIYFFKQEVHTYMYVKHYKQCFNGYKSYFTKIYKHKSTSQKDHVNAFIGNNFAVLRSPMDMASDYWPQHS